MSDEMYKTISSPAILRHSFLLLSAMLALAGCKFNEMPGDAYVPATHYERYPIDVKKAPITLDIASSQNPLQREQVAAVVRIANSARDAATTNITVKRPSGSRSLATSEQIVQILMSNGIPRNRISEATYPGSASSPVQISFVRSVAVTKYCGDWSHDLSNLPNNQEYANFGCAYQNNIAAMVSNPSDLATPRPSTMAPADVRATVSQQTN